MGHKIGELPEVSEPDAVHVRRNWIPLRIVDWVKDADEILMEHGAVRGTIRRNNRSARYQAQKLIRYMVELELHEPWELAEHVEKRGEGWLWMVEYRGNGRGRNE